jgi:hypothetical protein
MGHLPIGHRLLQRSGGGDQVLIAWERLGRGELDKAPAKIPHRRFAEKGMM